MIGMAFSLSVVRSKTQDATRFGSRKIPRYLSVKPALLHHHTTIRLPSF